VKQLLSEQKGDTAMKSGATDQNLNIITKKDGDASKKGEAKRGLNIVVLGDLQQQQAVNAKDLRLQAKKQDSIQTQGMGDPTPELKTSQMRKLSNPSI